MILRRTRLQPIHSSIHPPNIPLYCGPLDNELAKAVMAPRSSWYQ
jgi:hypothetical protein